MLIRRRATGRAKQLSDEEIAEQELGSEDLIVIDREDWPRLRVVLEVFFGVGERNGIEAAGAWLTARGIGWTWAKPAPRRQRRQRPPQRAPRPPQRPHTGACRPSAAP